MGITDLIVTLDLVGNNSVQIIRGVDDVSHCRLALLLPLFDVLHASSEREESVTDLVASLTSALASLTVWM
ncbi:hypothetical protein KCU62_g450, partial [Aureobasidium sp. EXF-3399]